MSDELLIPQVPEPKPEDPEDVSWALSTAEAMWARGDHSEGVKWVRRAAEAASDAEQDMRSLELAKAAADLASMLTRRGQSRASIHIDDGELMDDTPPAPPPPKPIAKPAPPKSASIPPPKNAAGAPSVTKQIATPSRPPAPLPSRTSQPPPGMGPRPVPKPSFTASPKPAPAVPKVVDVKKPKTKSKVNLEAEAKAAFSSVAPDTSPEPLDKHLTADTSEQPIAESPMMRRSRPELGGNDPTFVGNVNDIMKQRHDSSDDERSADEWDASPTQNLTGDELGFPEFPMPKSTRDNKSGGNGGPSSEDGRKTSLQLPTPDFKSTVQNFNKPKGAPAPASSPGGSSQQRAGESHDPSITTTQAVRVVVWRDGNGVHVAPAGTVVSAITVDAVLVALDSNADLTAWLTQKGR